MYRGDNMRGINTYDLSFEKCDSIVSSKPDACFLTQFGTSVVTR